MTIQFDTLTEAGTLKLMSALLPGGTRRTLTSYRIGSDAGFQPDPSETDVRNQVASGPAADLVITQLADNEISVILPQDTSVGGYNIGNIGLFLDDGTMLSLTALPQAQPKWASNLPTYSGNVLSIEIRLKYRSIGTAVSFFFAPPNFKGLMPVATKTGDHVIDATADFFSDLMFDSSTGNGRALPDAANLYPNGYIAAISHYPNSTGSNTVTFVPHGTDTVQGGTSPITIAKGETKWLRSDGTSAWTVIANFNNTDDLGTASSLVDPVHSNSKVFFPGDGSTEVDVLGAKEFVIGGGGTEVNYWKASGGTTGNGVVLQALGSDTNIDLILTPKGSGTVKTSSSTLTINDTTLTREASGVLSMRGASQSFRAYNAYTDPSNYERGIFDWATTANTLTIGAQALGTGVLRPVAFVGASYSFASGTITGPDASTWSSTGFLIGSGSVQLNATGPVVKSSGQIGFASTSTVTGSSTPDTILARDAANILARRNGTAAQGNRVYNTYTDANNYERGAFDWTVTANTLTIGAQALGTGVLRPVAFVGASFSFATDTTMLGKLIMSGNVIRGVSAEQMNLLTDGKVSFSNNAGSAGALINLTTDATFKLRNATDTGDAALTAGAATFSAAMTYGGVTLANSVQGTGSMVLSAGPTFTGTATFAGISATSVVTAYISTANSGSNKTVLSMTSGGAFYGSLQVESTAGNGAWSLGYQVSPNSTIGTPVLTWDGGGNVTIAGGTTALRKSTTAQTLQVYNTYTDGSNYERAAFDWTTTANTLTVGAQALGTGVLRAVAFVGASYSFASGTITGPDAGTWSSSGFVTTQTVQGTNVVSNGGYFVANSNWRIGGFGASQMGLYTSGATAQVVLDFATQDTLKVRNHLNTADATLLAGAGTFSSTLTGAGVVVNGGGVVTLTNSSVFSDISNGVFLLRNNGNTAGVSVDVTTDGTAKVRNRANSADGSLTALNLTASGNVAAGSGSTIGFNTRTVMQAPADGTLQVSPNAGGGIFLVAEGNDITALRHGTTAQTFHIYNTYTDASNYERASFNWTNTLNTLTIGAKALGTGVVRPVAFVGASYSFASGAVTMGTSLAIGGATIGTDALAVTGTATFSSTITAPTYTAPTGNLTIQSATNSNLIINAGGSGAMDLRTNSSSVLHMNTTRAHFSLPVYAADGASGAPSYAFNSEATTGFYWASASKTIYATNTHLVMMFGDNALRLNGNSAFGWASAGNDPTGAQAVGLGFPTSGLLTVDGSTPATAAASIGATKFMGGPAFSASYPMWKRNGTAWNARLGDDTADAAITAAGVTGSVFVATSGSFQATSLTKMDLSAADGGFQMTNQAGTAGAQMRFTTDGVAAFRTRNNAGDAAITAGGATFSSTIEQRNSTTAQVFRVYNTYTDPSNYERAVLDWSTNAGTLTFGTQAAGTGTYRNILYTGAVHAFNTLNGVQAQIGDNGATAVNNWLIKGAATTASISMAASGTDTNIGMTFTPKGTGVFLVNGVLQATRYQMSAVTTITDGATTTWDPTLNNHFKWSPAASTRTFATSTGTVPPAGTYYIQIIWPAAATRTLTFSGSFWKWAGAGQPAWTATTGGIDFINVYSDGTTAFMTGSANYA